MEKCIGIGRILGHHYEAREAGTFTQFGSDQSEPILTQLSNLLARNPIWSTFSINDIAPQIAALIRAAQGGTNETRYLGDICTRCGNVVYNLTTATEKTPEEPKPVASAPPVATAVIPTNQPGLHATVTVGPMRP